MITSAIQVTLFVKDMEASKTYYTEKLGFDVVAEEEFAPGWRYLTVAPHRNNETVLELVQADTPNTEALIGKQAADQVLIMFASNDIDNDYRELKARGVVFHGEPKSVPGGKGVGFEDLDGNQFDLYQAIR
ncbi:VOC family protein [Paenibacillus sp. JCM 10914]|uniref:VOC family protein n=1 Tax=Paenibacillus sp. JCM 10914 TaxID=1236974 RepID=UPI0003CCA7B0|nr:VOC family protein [Paenibacillus sp. JCM 10914]GAE05801.1 glyoxalase family protein [Paenibacillus sp. JCM 10914]